MPTSSENKHVVAFAFPFGSHPFPLLNLVLKLAHAAPNVTFSFINSAKSNQILFSKPQIPANVKPFSVSDGVPKGHVLGNHPYERLDLFLKAGPENLQKAMDFAVEETHRRVTCIIADAFVTPSLVLAQNLNVPWIPLWLPLSFSLSAHFYGDLIRRKNGNSEEDERENRILDFIPGYSEVKIRDLPQDVLKCDEEKSLFSQALASMSRVLPQAKAVVTGFYEELDPPLFVEDMKSKLQSLLYVGFLTVTPPLPPAPPSISDGNGCLPWLDKHSAKSVAYVSFGTTVAPPPHELVAVAEALEESGVPFLWSLREDLKGFLPNAFLEKPNMDGKIVAWAPQSQVLAHDAIGVYVTHCGCSSVNESIANGVPMICRPYFGDQAMAARMVEDSWGIGVRIEGGVFTKNGLLKSLRLILVHEDGKKIRENAQVIERIVRDAAGPEEGAARDFKTLVEITS
ncbi:hypothetical protein L6164_036409 [Bauhinia variegata]|uniref:Uncharacterized protein n=1 Tax=Bauhinia variegata TaxID=167791 RepID=A0ACB9KGY2_BAUVA|nr:hypothetical protein L6164_036409 [Bauhinia variegata]